MALHMTNEIDPNSSQFPRNASLVRSALRFVQRQLRSGEFLQILACAILGASIGVVVAGLRRLVDWLHRISFHLPPKAALSAGLDVDPMSILFLPFLGGMVLGISAIVMRRVRPSEIVDPIEANALHGGKMSLFDSTRLVAATVLSNAAGAAVGMEAGYSQLGSGLFSAAGQLAALRRMDLRVFVGAGAAAGIAAAFNAPLAGAFYAFELIIGGYAIRALAPIALAALVAALTQRALINPEPLFLIPQGFHFKQSVYLLFALLGLFAAGFSVLAMQAVTWSERLLRRLPTPLWLRPAIGGIALSLIAILVPQVLGSGHGAVQQLFDTDVGLHVLLILLIAKLLASAISLGSGYRGGMFSASLMLGTIFGAVFGHVAALILPRLAMQQTPLMMVGMGSVAAGVIGAPLTMVFLVLEGTGDFPMTIGVLVGVIISSSVVRISFGYSFSTWRFHQRGIAIRSPHDVGWLADLTVDRLMRRDPKTVNEDTLLSILRQEFPIGTAKRVFVTSAAGAYRGILDPTVVHDGKYDKTLSLTAGSLATFPKTFLRPFQNVKSALALFEKQQVETLPVIQNETDGIIVGYLTEQYALRRYNQELERRRSAELGERDLFSIAEPPPRS